MLGLLAVLLALALALPAGARAAEAGVGVNNADATQVGAVKALGAHWVRMFVSWRSLQPTPAPVSEATLSGWEGILAEYPAGTKVILDVVNSPSWETGSADEHAPPANPSDYASVLATLAARFGTRVAAYEIWNEEDEPRWWTGAPNPAAYVALLRATYPAIKAANPQATVLLGGLTGNDYPFVEGVYAAGGKGYFDAVAVHTDTACNLLSPYEFLRGVNGRMIPDSFLAYREVRSVMLANGDDKPIWMTELSWRTSSAECEEGMWAGQKLSGVTDEEQATFLGQAYHCLAQDPYVKVALWFPVQDEGPVVSGLMRADGSHKPSFAAMREYLRHGDQVQGECGAFKGPAIHVSSPSDRIRYSGPLPIKVSASSSQGVWRITLQCDGHTLRNYEGKTYPHSLAGFLNWQGAKHISRGKHLLTIIAYDRERNVSRVYLLIYHRRGHSSRVHHGHHH